MSSAKSRLFSLSLNVLIVVCDLDAAFSDQYDARLLVMATDGLVRIWRRGICGHHFSRGRLLDFTKTMCGHWWYSWYAQTA